MKRVIDWLGNRMASIVVVAAVVSVFAFALGLAVMVGPD